MKGKGLSDICSEATSSTQKIQFQGGSMRKGELLNPTIVSRSERRSFGKHPAIENVLTVEECPRASAPFWESGDGGKCASISNALGIVFHLFGCCLF